MPTVYALTPHERLTVLESTPELLAFDARWEPHASSPVTHFHPAQTEQFEVLEGALAVTLGGEERVVAAGERFTVEPGVRHAMAPANGEPARARWEVRPALATERMFRAIDAAQPAGGAAPGPAAMLPIVARHRAEFRLASPPDALQGPLFALVRLFTRG